MPVRNTSSPSMTRPQSVDARARIGQGDAADLRQLKEIHISAAGPNKSGDRLPSNWPERLDDGMQHDGLRQSLEGGVPHWCVSVDAFDSKDPGTRSAALSLLGVVKNMGDLFVVTVDPRLLADPKLKEQLDDTCEAVGGLTTTTR